MEEELKLSIHEKKLFLRTLASGMDFLGWVHFPHHRKLRTATKKRMLRRLAQSPEPQAVNSYRGMLRHGNTYKIQKQAGLT